MKSPIAYLVAAFVLAFAVLLLVPLWSILGGLGGGHGGHAVAAIEPADYFAYRIAQQMKKYGQPDGSLQLTSSGDVYIMAPQFAFVPKVIRLETGKKYSLHFYSPDVIHGVSLIYVDQYGLGRPYSLNNVLPPGPITTVTITPNLPGTILIACTEYCGVGHHLMQAKIIVSGEPYPIEVTPWYQRIGIHVPVVPMWLHHDLYIRQATATDPQLIWTPPEYRGTGVFMAPHGEWKYWHYHGPIDETEEFYQATDVSDGILDGKITPGTPGIPSQLVEHFNLPPQKTKIYLNRPTR